LIEGAFQNALSTDLADLRSARWSHSFVRMTYHEASDMMSRRISTERETRSPDTHRALRP
jgi:hypothetical protein